MKRIALLLPFAAAALIAGCGSSNSSSTQAPASAPASSSSATSATAPSGGASAASGGGSVVKVSEIEFKILPKADTAKPGKITFDIHNNGKVDHAFAITTPGGLKQTSDISPGSSTTLTVDITKAGSYTFYCPVPGHRMLGMVGTLTVGG